MKMKMFALAALSLAGWALSAAPASAWWWHNHHGLNRYSTVIVCRPYNAFSPCCSGSLVCDGCCPYGCPNLPTGAACNPGICNPLFGLCHDPASIQYAAAPHGMPYGAPYGMAQDGYSPGAALPPGGANQQFQPPPPMPVPGQTQLPIGYGYGQPLVPTGYYPPAYPGYYPQMQMPAPMNYNPYQQRTPGYRYGN